MSQGFVREILRHEELYERVPEQVRVLSVVEPPFQFVQVGVKMLLGDMMERADNRPLGQGSVMVCLRLQAGW